MDRNQPITTYRRGLLNPLKKVRFLRGPLEAVRVNDPGEKRKC